MFAFFVQGAFQASWLDESDCVGAWESDAVAAVLFPTGGTLPNVRQLDAAQVGTEHVILKVST